MAGRRFWAVEALVCESGTVCCVSLLPLETNAPAFAGLFPGMIFRYLGGFYFAVQVCSFPSLFVDGWDGSLVGNHNSLTDRRHR